MRQDCGRPAKKAAQKVWRAVKPVGNFRNVGQAVGTVMRAGALHVILTGAALAIGAGEAEAGTENFRRSCKNIRYSQMTRRTLIQADCDVGRYPDGRIGLSRNPTQLLVPTLGCADISNQRGELRCIGAQHPGGSWSQSCVEGRFLRGRVFQAVCTPFGTRAPSVYSSVDMNRCPSFQLENINGQLRCK
jgi:hypothetical protein